MILQFCFALLVGFSGCTLSLSEKKQQENLLPTPCFENTLCTVQKSRDMVLGTCSEEGWPERCWWQRFNEPALDLLIEEALARNPTLEQARQRLAFAAAQARRYRSALFPYIFFGAEDTYEYLSENGLYKALNPKIPRSANLIDVRLALNYDFDFWGKNANLWHAAQAEAFAQYASMRETELIITSAVAQSFFALKADLARLALYQRIVQIRTALYDLQDLRLAHALDTKLTPLSQEESLQEAKKWLSSIENDIAKDRHQLNILAGRAPDIVLCLDAGLADMHEPLCIPSNLSLDLLAHRPDLAAQIFRAKALAHEVGAACAEFFPDVNIKSFVGLETIISSKLFQLGSACFGAKPALHLPLYTAGGIAANVSAKQALFNEAIYNYNERLLKGAQEVCDLLALAQDIFEEKRAQNRIVESAKGRFSLSQLRRQSGLDSLLDNYLLEDELIQKELDNITLLYSQYAVSIKLIKALGGGFFQNNLPYEPAQSGACP